MQCAQLVERTIGEEAQLERPEVSAPCERIQIRNPSFAWLDARIAGGGAPIAVVRKRRSTRRFAAGEESELLDGRAASESRRTAQPIDSSNTLCR